MNYAAAACAPYPTAWWFATGNARAAADAVRICSTCPIAGPCRDAGRAGREWGIWGGETQEERARAGYPPANGTHLPGPGHVPTYTTYVIGCRCRECYEAAQRRRAAKAAAATAARVEQARRTAGRTS